MKKSFFAFLLAAVLLLTVQPASAAQEEDLAQLRQALLESCTTGETVNIEAYEIDYDTFEAFWTQTIRTSVMPWYYTNYSVRYNTATGYLVDFTPELADPTEYDYILYEQKIAEIIDATVCDGMNQWQMALAVHDYLAAHSIYDESLTYWEGYDLIVRGTSVCNGYANAYMDIMNRLGVECRMTVSADGTHGWNLIKIDGNWYHVDVTWDDPVSDAKGRVMHTYFLVTDEELLADGDPSHIGWDQDISCTDTSFQDAFWKDVTSQICYADSSTSYLRRDIDWVGYIQRRDETTGEETTLYTDDTDYIDLGNGAYAYPHLGLTLWNDRLYFTQVDRIRSCALDGSDARTEFDYDVAGNDKFIYSSFVTNDTLYLTLADADYGFSTLEVSLEPTGYHVHSYETVVTPPTCLEAGLTSYQCACGITVHGEEAEATGHTYLESNRMDPTISEEGSVTYICLNCDDSYTEVLPVALSSGSVEGLLENLPILLAGLFSILQFFAPIVVVIVAIFLLVVRKKKKKKK